MRKVKSTYKWEGQYIGIEMRGGGGGGGDGECVGNILARDMKEREQNDDQSRTTDSYREAKCR